ncbi:hypothetical protein ACFL2U_00120 [Patescibacteria group bacterium]
MLGLIKGSLSGALNAMADDPGYLSPFAAEDDTVLTQVKIYAALLDEACKRLKPSIIRLLEGQIKQAKAEGNTEVPDEVQEEHYIDLLNMLRSGFAITAIGTNVASLNGSDAPLFMDFLMEKLEGKENPQFDEIEHVVDDFLTILGLKEFFEKNGVRDQLLAQLEAAL